MFTGIIEAIGIIRNRKEEGRNIRLTIESTISPQLKIDQSVSHDGVCLTVVGVEGTTHDVVAVAETLKRSNFKSKQTGDIINLERSMMMNGRLDGHIVQGHVDDVAVCRKIESKEGSWVMSFRIDPEKNYLLVDKGSVCINGVSLTVINPGRRKFSVAIIPYTFEHTNLHSVKPGDTVNLEFDIIGKYIARILKPQLS